ncbi:MULTISPECIES: DinB family protein [Roseobacteraceae]|uniref:DinB family protein n=1 Tax=Pseudosulfitobacter pseudonitzschiae TaxID=1402135 RepID=A0A221K034_9RHOB|nr:MULTISPECIES: DinB family protein [Roseobacteraceae]ASM72253.1 DinB family protein [Pseudosulfitobacter pseudonitzschiae]
MIDKSYVATMARYNAWQNSQLTDIVTHMDHEALELDRGAFFGSILGTLNHLLWGDRIWLNRFGADVDAPELPLAQSAALTPTVAAWGAERFQVDGRLTIWADGLHNLDLAGGLTWFSGSVKTKVTRPFAECVVHMFNHQTHHRGQVHAMLTAAGQSAPVSDLFIMNTQNGR